MKPLPFTFSSLDTFRNCPSQYHHKYVLKDVTEVQSPQAAYGDDVHQLFQAYIEAGGETMDCRFNCRRVLVRSEIGTPTPSDVSDRLMRYSNQRSVQGTNALAE